MKIQFHRIDTNVVVGLLVREFCCSGTDVSAKVLAMYADTRTPSMEPQWLAAGLSQHKIPGDILFNVTADGKIQITDARGHFPPRLRGALQHRRGSGRPRL